MSMDFQKIIIKGYRESETHGVDEKDKSSIRADYFVRMAKNAIALNFTLEDFFDGCEYVLKDYTLTLMAVWLERLDLLDKIIQEIEKAIASGQTHGNIIDDGNGNAKFDSTGTRCLTDFLERAKREKILLDELGGHKKSAFWVDENGEKAEKDHHSNVAINNHVLEKLKTDLEKAKWWLTKDNENSQATEKVINKPVSATSEVQEKPKADGQIYRYKATKIAAIYDFCTDESDMVFSKDEVSLMDFLDAVSSANFAAIYNAEKTKLTKCRYIIYILNYHIKGEGWYKKVAQSINVEPNKCSGAYVPTGWKKAASKL